jgi:hypothetical protein
MDKQQAYLCIGGPWDGKRYAAKNNENYFKVPHISKLPIASFSVTECVSDKIVDIKYTLYVAQCFREHRKESVWFWRPSEQSLTDSLLKLLERYEQSSNLKWN